MNSPQNPQDSSTPPPPPPPLPPPLPAPPPPNRRTKQPGTAAAWSNSSSLTFPYKLHDMLAAAEYENFTSIVSWEPHGNSFKIHKKEEFVSRILPRFFNATKYNSFYIQLNNWRFKSCGNNTDAFSHQHFVREKPELCKHMSRKKKTGKKSDTKYNTFPYRLHELLAAAECEQSTSIVSWLPDGRSFRIHDIPGFESSILPRFFNITKYDSFYRQLMKWGFKPCREEGHNTFFHEYFVRHNPEQCSILSYRTSKDAVAVFPRRLHQLLESAEIETFTSVISWLPDGKSIKVHNKEQFVSSILPRFFPSQHCYESFYLQLNLWGFKGCKGCPGKGSFTYSHKYFVRGKPELCDIMTRKQQRASPSEGATTTNSNNTENGCSDQFFPNRLHHMLRAAESEQFTSIISWLPDGKSFQIHNKEKFVSSILPRFFPTLHHYVSFYTKLSSFGFKSKRNSTYSHEHFVRDNLELWNLMAKKQTATGSQNSATERADRFPFILQKMLETAETEDFVSVVSWLPDGRSFKVHNKNEFISSVMPRFFDTMVNFKSFYDQLNAHGFQCPRMHTYLHQHFLRDDPKSCHLISRTTYLSRKRKSETLSSNNNINNDDDYFSTMNTDKDRQPTLVGSASASAKMSTTIGDESIDDANKETRSRGTESPPFDGHHASAGQKRPPLQNTSYADPSSTSTGTAKQEVIDISSDEDENQKINPDYHINNNCYLNEQLTDGDQEMENATNISRMAGGFPSSHHESSSVAYSQQQQEIAMDGTAATIGGEKNEEEPDYDQIAMDACMRGFQASYLMGKNSNYESTF